MTTITIQPQYIKFADLISKRLFRIPDYQRSYSWAAKHRQDLFQDIIALREKPNNLHFMATLVGLRRDIRTIVTDEYTVLDIVDGQQRLTTLIVLIKSIQLALSRKSTTDELNVASELNKTLVKGDDLSLILLQTNHDSSNYFIDYLRNGTIPNSRSATTLADRAIVSCIGECEAFVNEWSESNDLLTLLALIKNRLTFIFHEIQDEVAVYTVFEVLNSRGLEVAWLDRLKSMLMAVAFENDEGNRQEHIKELHELWKQIYAKIGLRQGLRSEAVRFAATLSSTDIKSRVYGEEDAVLHLREQCGTSPSKAISITKWLLNVVIAIDGLLSQGRRAAVTRIAHARLLAIAIELKFEGDDREVLLKQWERVTFRIFGMCRKDARTKVGDYVRLAKLINDGMASDDVLTHLQELGKDEFSIENAAEALYNNNCYEGWEEELRYFMARYEEHLATTKNNRFSNEQWERIWEDSAAKSIEHIYPQSKADLSGMAGELNIHRLGNLVLLPPGLNSSLGNKTPSNKKQEYNQTGLLCVQELLDQLDTWDLTAVDIREKTLLEWAREEWADLPTSVIKQRFKQ